ncbi:histone deacetylase HOS2 [Candida parapsilosis]|nr:histone deacetylase HOS2 [Candida parapsilosis]KAI5908075.1 histone deacetylase HOS2 [Candida parapsilosis]CAD1813252.1 unnamed protein product [Candida parapsilosis]
MEVPTDETETFAVDKQTKKHTPLYHPNKSSKTKVSYHYNPEVANYHYGTLHPMKPFRLMLTDHLVSTYKLHEKMDLYTPRRATKDELLQFHSEDYIDFLQSVTPETVKRLSDQTLAKFNIGDDCPVFDSMFDYSSIYAGASLDASRKIIAGMSDIAINWSGGLHHAKKFEPSGFCYINDIVLCIINLLRIYPRVLYVDIDLHHGDGVQEAFYTTDRVMTVSFHKYDGEFFPGTGSGDEVGIGKGKNFSINVPLRDGVDDESYVALFKSIMQGVIPKFQPSIIVAQCGADSLGGDRLGRFNLSLKGHGSCLNFLKSFEIPMVVLGGGGYTPKNVSRLWCYETAVLTDTTLNGKIPNYGGTYQWFGDEGLHPELTGKIENKNTKRYLESVLQNSLEHLRYLDYAPSVQMYEIPPDL